MKIKKVQKKIAKYTKKLEKYLDLMAELTAAKEIVTLCAEIRIYDGGFYHFDDRINRFWI